MLRGDRVSLASDPTTEALVVKILGQDTVRIFWRRHPTQAGRYTIEREDAFAEPVPIWLDSSGRRCRTYPCQHCGRPTPMYRMHGRDLWATRGGNPSVSGARPIQRAQ
jgi:hypothetical protein